MTTRFALATPSYAGDFERCRLLCASVDRFVDGHDRHYILVEDADLPLFATLAGPRREIMPESALLPAWLAARNDPFSRGRRRVWTGFGALRRGVPPLRGWHAQQLRKIALPLRAEEDVFVFADSDMIFLRPFALGSLESPDGTRLFRKPDGITAAMPEHALWSRNAARLLGVAPPALPGADYINNMVSWRRDNVRAMVARIEAVGGRDWVSALGRQRSFSEYMVYGQFVEQVLGLAAARHLPNPRELCRNYWGAGDLGGGLASFRDILAPYQVAVGVQSFIDQPVARLREMFEAA